MKKIKLEELKQLVQTNNKPLFVTFSAKWCGVCKMNLPVIEPIVKKFINEIDFLTIDVDEESAWEEDGNKEYAIHTVPTYHLYYEQQLLFNHSNFLAPAILEEQLMKVLKK